VVALKGFKKCREPFFSDLMLDLSPTSSRKLAIFEVA
jgi:hypothetical protein